MCTVGVHPRIGHVGISRHGHATSPFTTCALTRGAPLRDDFTFPSVRKMHPSGCFSLVSVARTI